MFPRGSGVPCRWCLKGGVRRPSRSSGMGYQIRIEGDGAVKKPHGRPVCQAGSVLGERREEQEPHGRPVCQARSVLGERREEQEPHGRPVCQARSVLGERNGKT